MMKSVMGEVHAQADDIFMKLLPSRGLAVRPSQIELCHTILDGLFAGNITLCDAGTGTGKTYAYLVACILWQKYCPSHIPRTVTISTTSVALQDALVKEYIPFLSQCLLETGVIDHPLHALIRKGKERYVCDARLAKRQAEMLRSIRISAKREAVLTAMRTKIDMDDIAGLSGYDRRRICVPPDCADCDRKSICRYQAHLCRMRETKIDFQICNHNFLLADVIHRQQESRPLLQDYHVLIVDEAHKLTEAAQTMYSRDFAFEEIQTICRSLSAKGLTQMAQRLQNAGNALEDTLKMGYGRQSRKRGTLFLLTPERKTALEQLITQLRRAARPAFALPRAVRSRIEEKAGVLELFLYHSERYILCIQHDRKGKPILNAFRRHIPELLARDVWKQVGTAALVSGTLAAGGDFAHMRRQTGLDRNMRTKEYIAGLPFDYIHNSLLYIPDGPAEKNRSAARIAQTIRELVTAAHGHTLVLFTSYQTMSAVCAKIRGTLPFPVLEAWRGGHQTVKRFRELPNAVLCAAGPCWEGLDFPGDMVSLLVIVHLPFPVPDSIRAEEQKQYPDTQTYIREVVVPEMQIKLRQGAGRAIRTETDTCAIAILDRRAASGGRYHEAVCGALREFPITDSIKDIELFIRSRKGPEYFECKGGSSA